MSCRAARGRSGLARAGRQPLRAGSAGQYPVASWPPSTSSPTCRSRSSGYALEGLRAEVSSGFERLSTVVHLQGGGHRGRRRGRRLRRRRPGRAAGGRPGARSRRPLHARRILRADRLARSVSGRAPAGGLAAVPPLDVPQRRARPRAAPGRQAAARGARPRRRSRSRSSSRCGSASRRASSRSSAGSRATRRCASSSTRRAPGRPS